MSPLGPSHRHVLASALADILHRVSELEAAVARGAEPDPFSGLVDDLSAEEKKVARDRLRQIRRDVMAWCDRYDVVPSAKRTGLRWVLQSSLAFVRVMVDDMGPRRLRGYGNLDAAIRDQLVRMQAELGQQIDWISRYLEPAGDAEQRSGE